MRQALDSTAQPGLRAVLYDPEGWQFTPEDEQRNFGAFNRRAAGMAHARNLLLISAPAVTLARVLAGAGGRPYDRFLALELAAEAARDADVVNIQAQGSLPVPGKYRSFVEAAAAQVRAANPRVLVFAGLSTNPSGQRVDAGAIIRAIDATRQVVDGYWFNVPQRSEYSPRATEFRPDTAIEVFRRLTDIE